MKKTSILIAVCLLAVPCSAVMAGMVDSEVQKALVRMTDAYMKENPQLGMKKGLAVLKFTEASDAARQRGLGSTLRELVSGNIVNSQVFFLIDRDALDAILREQKLALTGAIDESSMAKMGELAGVQVFISGSVSEAQDKFVVTMKMTDAGSGKVVAMEKIELPQNELYSKQKEMAFAYISKYGLGINYEGAVSLLALPVKCGLIFNDIYVNYRPFLWLNFKLGITYLYFRIGAISNISPAAIYPDLQNHTNAAGYSTLSPVNYLGGTMDLFSPFIGVDYNWTPVEWFTLAVGASFSAFLNPVLYQTYTHGLVYNASNDTLSDIGVLYVEQRLQSIGLLRLEVKPQFFISPRMTVGIYLAYIFGGDNWALNQTVINGEYNEFPALGVTNSYTAAMRQKYLNMRPDTVSDANTLSQITLRSGIILGFSFNFYF